MGDAQHPPVLAPQRTSRFANFERRLTETSWEVQQGEHLAAFIEAVGPTTITRYNFDKHWCSRPNGTVEHRPAFANLAGSVQRQHHFDDLFHLTAAGEARHVTKPHSPGHTYVLRCTGRGHRVPAGEEDPTNCTRKCGGGGWCEDDCEERDIVGHLCSAKLHIIRTLDNVKRGVVLVVFKGAHVADGEAVSIREEALTEVKRYVHARESTKGEATDRCVPLFRASRPGSTEEEFLSALGA
eukprot:CAMPEP_0173386912 /NCGR_PEP_ID=MMETSP1356-20130122/9477_1 /TAXON_ID=77927 ORGANISM="Hemiselmis virescens, Strain PCC157" /NCGR_SAMPLE_ID=MMETSP1356 /ASSEMBLY_ACC=CAM_ASM_000847 /LENGTH=239 /DNA_ID=CAMNT_0014343327 /DNA_START=119 /DNA_END=834 /DNA_ORIENTATION=-